MKLQHKINSLVQLKAVLLDRVSMESIIQYAHTKNNWFTPFFVNMSLDAICLEFLDEQKLKSFVAPYAIDETRQTVGIIMAGNIPAVGFHDFLCAYLCDVDVKIKLSSKDEILMKFIIESLLKIDTSYQPKVQIVERIDHIDKIIATGSNNSFRYFEYYFRKYPTILRKNRTSIAVLTGEESDEELEGLIDDIFLYFGMGCRNVTKVYVPRGYVFNRLFELSIKYGDFYNHQKYMNNFEYNRTVFLMKSLDHLCNDYWIIKEDNALFSPIAVLNFEYYDDVLELNEQLKLQVEDLQCIVSKFDLTLPTIGFGSAQKPSIVDFADGVDTMNFILGK